MNGLSTRKKLLGLWGSAFLGLGMLLTGCGGPSQDQIAAVADSGASAQDLQMTDEEMQEAIIARAEMIKTDCRERGGKSCEVMALEALADYENSRDFGDLKSAIYLAGRACGSERRYCLVKGDMMYRAWQDGLDIETWLPGRYIREELEQAYTLATEAGDLAIAAEAYHKMGMVNTKFKRFKEAKQNFAMSCKIGGGSYCVKGAEAMADAGSKESALDSYRKACEFNNSSACLRLGDRLYELKKYKEGDAAYSKACDLNDGAACQALADRYTRTGNKEGARKAYARSCELGHESSCFVLGRAQVRMGNLSDSLTFFNKSCESGNQLACQFIGTYSFYKGKLNEAYGTLSKSCEQGNSQACYLQGLANQKGSQKFFTDACNADHKMACNALIASYGNLTTGASLAYARACDGGSADACMQLANSAINNDDMATAQQAYDKGCKLKSPLGCERLAVLDMQNGRYDNAIKNHIKACSMNSGTSCTQLAFAYTEGVGVPKSTAKALTYFQRACKLGVKDACYIVDGKRK